MRQTFNIKDLSGCWPYYHFMGCPKCSTRFAPFVVAYPYCPTCNERMHIFTVTQEEFDAWLKHKAQLLKLQLGGHPPDFNMVLRRAEHEINYRSMRAIEMYLPVWEKQPAYYLFLKCAEHYSLCQGEIEKCRFLMQEYGMVEEGA